MNLTIDISKAYTVIIEKVQLSYSATGKDFNNISAYPTNAKHCNTGTTKGIYSRFAKK